MLKEEKADNFGFFLHLFKSAHSNSKPVPLLPNYLSKLSDENSSVVLLKKGL